MDRQIGIFDFNGLIGTPGATPELLRYNEFGGRIALSQVFASAWFASLGYQFTRAELDRTYPLIPASPAFARTQSDRSDLHRIGSSLLYQRPDGWFARTALHWLYQENINPAAPATDDTVQLNIFAGWRFPKLHGDITLGILNLTGANYHLHPLTLHEEFPRSRTFYVRFQLSL